MASTGNGAVNGTGEVATILNSLSRDAPAMSRSKPLRLSRIEQLPTEVVQLIAAYISDDSSFLHFARQTSTTLCHMILPKDSPVWRVRFLNLYDYPDIPDFTYFSIAWRVRQYVLGRGHDVDFRNPDGKTNVVLKVIHNVVLESFNPNPRLGTPKVSKNLEYLMAVPTAGITPREGPLHAFLSCAEIHRLPWTQQHDLHAELRLTLAFLFLNPAASSYHRKLYDDEGYDLKHIYLVDIDFSLLYDPRVGINFANLIHILNFWSNQFCNPNASSCYREMALTLAQHGRTVKPWNAELAEFNAVNMHNKWVGQYTCYHNASKNQKSLWQHQTCAEDDWTFRNPLILDFSLLGVCTTRASEVWKVAFWPRIFRQLPCFYASFEQTDFLQPQRYIRGFAYFQDIRSDPASKGCKHLKMVYHSSNHQAYNALHLSGIVYPIAAGASNAETPGFASVKMILYRPTDYYILRCLWEFFCRDVPVNARVKDGIKLLSPEGRYHLDRLWETEILFLTHTPNEIALHWHQRYLENFLDDLQLTNADFLQIEKVANNADDVGEILLQWADLREAYAYEGVLTPGGKLMLGRWFALKIDDLDAYDRNFGGPAEVFSGQVQPQYGISRDDVGGFVFWADE